MKRLTAKSKVDAANRLHKLIENRKRLEKEEKELKTLFKNELNNKSGAIVVGSFLITLDDKQRAGLSKSLLVEAYGSKHIAEFEILTNYQQLIIKKVG